jgi:uncharacterized protein YkwD
LWCASFSAVVSVLLCGSLAHAGVKPPPQLAVRALESGAVSILVSDITSSATIVTVQRRVGQSRFVTVTSARTTSSDIELVDVPESLFRLSYRAQVRFKGGGASRWSALARVVKVTIPPEKDPEVPFGAPQPPSGLKLCPGALVSSVLSLTNTVRAEVAGVPALTLNDALINAAQKHSLSMAELGSLSHTGWLQGLLASGYKGTGMAQNIASGFPTMESALEGWLSSASHRLNLLNPQWTETGVGCAVDSNGRIWWTQNFGKP